MNARPDNNETLGEMASRLASEHNCQQCGKPNYGWILGAVCGHCCRNNQRKANGLKFKVNRKSWTN